jgi:hypothetical protein
LNILPICGGLGMQLQKAPYSRCESKGKGFDITFEMNKKANIRVFLIAAGASGASKS